jgi:hypothetical protein
MLVPLSICSLSLLPGARDVNPLSRALETWRESCPGERHKTQGRLRVLVPYDRTAKTRFEPRLSLFEKILLLLFTVLKFETPTAGFEPLYIFLFPMFSQHGSLITSTHRGMPIIYCLLWFDHLHLA